MRNPTLFTGPQSVKTFFLIFLLPALCFANDPSVAISGKVVGRGGDPVSGCVVSMEGSELKARSDAAGKFLLTGEEPVSTAPYIVHIDCPDRPRRTLRLTGTKASLGVVRIFKQPNFVVILTDDQGYSDLGTFGSGTAPAEGWLEKDRIPILCDDN
jgi:hypothetical protein